MDYPIVISGKELGRLNVNADGLYTVFEAWIPNQQDNVLIRLWVCGDEKRALLGVMRPEKGGLYLRKKLSRSAMKDFPKNVLYACHEGDTNAESADVRIITDERRKEENCENTVSEQMQIMENEEEKSLLWFASASGVLSAFDGNNSLTAIPASLRRAPTGADVRVIDGKEYIVFRKH